MRILISVIIISLIWACENQSSQPALVLNDQEYFETHGLNVMVYDDFYPEGHQGGVSIILHGNRIAANGDVRLEPSPGQWSPIPKITDRTVDSINQEIRVKLAYPDSSRHRQGFNPIIYPDLVFDYQVRVHPQGTSFKVIVDLDEPLPAEWIGKVGFNLELFPGDLFGNSWQMDDEQGIFPRQANGPMYYDEDGNLQIKPMAEGKILQVAPESPLQHVTFQNLGEGNLQLLDGRGLHNNSWFVIRSLIPANVTENAIEWLIKPNLVKEWQYVPVVQLSQVGYHPNQSKFAVIETDHEARIVESMTLQKISDGKSANVLVKKPEMWGDFLRYRYFKFDFSEITEPGMYQINYGNKKTHPFEISETIYDRNVWQPTLEYFLPVQMCHMRINDRYKVWHGLCHMDDALMAPTDTNHFDGYKQGPSTLTRFAPSQPVPGLNKGGWHDAGDYDLRVESQSGTTYMLALAYEHFAVDYDNTTIDPKNNVVEMLRPDGVPDVLQQIEHGVRTVVGGYESLGRLYRGIICPTLRQYTLLGDGSVMTDNLVYDPGLDSGEVRNQRSGIMDDRWVFTEENPRRALDVAGELAATARVLQDHNAAMAEKCLTTAKNLWQEYSQSPALAKIKAATELTITTGDDEYKNFLKENAEVISENIQNTGWIVARALPLINDAGFTAQIHQAVRAHKAKIDSLALETPYGVPYRPHIWGAGWGIQRFGVEQYFWHTGYPEIFDADYMMNALNFVLGCHPGSNNASFASGIGSKSLEVAYGVNRDEWSYIPGGVGSGTALIRPDFPELKTWPYFWQQSEYVMGGGATNFMFLVLATREINK